jgi:6-phosphofructokinase 1
MPLDGYDLTVKKLGPCRRDSPLAELLYLRRSSHHWVDASDRVLLDDTAAMARARGVAVEQLPGFEAGGPRRKIFFDPSKTRVGIVTCGGLCPGLNNVIRGLVMELTRHYGVHRIVGFRNGYQGFIAHYGHSVMELTPDLVRDINEDGGTILAARAEARTLRRSSIAWSSSGSTS